MVAPYISDEVKQRPVLNAPETLNVFDRPAIDEAPAQVPAQLEKFATTPSRELTDELDGAAEWLGVDIEEILLAAFGRTLGRTRGEGSLPIDVTDGHRWLSHPVTLLCSGAAPMSPTEMLQGAHTALREVSGRAGDQSEVLLNVSAVGLIDVPAGRALELRVQRVDGLLQVDWWYDPRRMDAYSVEELAEQFPLALIDITSDAAAPL